MSGTSTREDRITSGCLQIAGFAFFILFVLFSWWPEGDGGTGARTHDLVWRNFDVTIDVRADGSLHVTEYQEIIFDGNYSEGMVEIPMDRIESINNVSITLEKGVHAEEGETYLHQDRYEPAGDLMQAEEVAWGAYERAPNTFRARQEGGLYLIDYAFDPVSQWLNIDAFDNDTRTIILEYDVHGAIRDYPDAEEPWQQLHWMAISTGTTDIAAISGATVTINLPEQVAEDDLVVAPEPTENDGRQIRWERTLLNEGDSVDVQVAFPTITDATSPTWQEVADARDASLEEREQRQNAGRLMLILAGIAIVVVGGLTVLYGWYRGIREPSIRPVHHEITEPPGQLPAVLVGSLLDEEVHPRDIAAGILDLDRQGIITIRNGTESETENYYLTLNDYVPARPLWAREVLSAIFGARARGGTTMGFSALRDLFGPHREVLQHAIDQTLVDQGYYEELPETSRKRWTWVTYGLVVASFIAAIAIVIWLGEWTWWCLIPLLPGIALFWYGRRLTPHIAQKTQKGAEVAAQWRAFHRHLISSQHGWRSEGTRVQIQVEYGPWLTAFGLERGWLSEMNPPIRNVGRSRPVSGASAGRGDRSTRQTSSSGGPSLRGRDASGPTLTPPSSWRSDMRGWDVGSWRDMQSASDGFGSTLSSMSESGFSMIGDMLESLGTSSGGGGKSSGGRSSARRSSSRRSSRSGGGRSRSSSGGGRRGFR